MQPVTLASSLPMLALALASASCAPEKRQCSAGPLLAQARERGQTGTVPGLEGDPPPAAYVQARAVAELHAAEDFQPCSNDAAEALRWATAAHATITGAPGPLVRSSETSAYFQFETERGLAWRVHRCTYLDRSPRHDSGGDGVYLGTLGARPVTADEARRACLRTFGLRTDRLPYDEAIHDIVLSCASSREDDLFVETCGAAMIEGGDFPDMVKVRRVRITVDPTTGEMRRSTGPVIATESETCE